MPIYEFECTNCGERFDRLQKLSDPDPETCPTCGQPKIKRRLTAPAFRLAGSGWYETDFKKDGDKKRNLADKGESASSSTTSESATKTESKPESAKSAETSTPASKAKPDGNASN